VLSAPTVYGRPRPNSSGGPRGWRITPDALLFTIGLGAFVLVLWPMVVALRGPQPLKLPVLLAHLCGGSAAKAANQQRPTATNAAPAPAAGRNPVADYR
jgi:hypothetical protein